MAATVIVGERLTTIVVEKIFRNPKSARRIDNSNKIAREIKLVFMPSAHPAVLQSIADIDKRVGVLARTIVAEAHQTCLLFGVAPGDSTKFFKNHGG